MGIASQDVTGDGYPDVFLTSQGSNRLQTLTAGPGRPTYGDIGLKRGVLADRPFAGGEDLPSTAWHPEFDDVNNDGFDGPVHLEGQRPLAARLRDQGPEQPAPRPAGRNLPRGRRGRRHRRLRPRAAAPRSPTSTSTACSTSSRSISARRSGSGGTSGRARPPRRQPMGHWLQVRVLDAERSEPRRDRRLARGPGERHDDAPGAHHRRRPRRRPAGLDPRRARRGDQRRDPRPVARRRARAVAGGRAPISSSTSTAERLPSAVDAARPMTEDSRR